MAKLKDLKVGQIVLIQLPNQSATGEITRITECGSLFPFHAEIHFFQNRELPGLYKPEQLTILF